MPDLPRAFKVPMVPLIPIFGCCGLFGYDGFLPLDTWVRLLVWMIIGFDVYLFYGMKNSLLSDNNPVTLMKSTRTISWIGVALTALLIGVAIIHHHITDGADTGLYYFSLVFAAAHFILYVFKAATAASVKAK